MHLRTHTHTLTQAHTNIHTHSEERIKTTTTPPKTKKTDKGMTNERKQQKTPTKLQPQSARKTTASKL